MQGRVTGNECYDRVGSQSKAGNGRVTRKGRTRLNHMAGQEGARVDYKEEHSRGRSRSIAGQSRIRL